MTPELLGKMRRTLDVWLPNPKEKPHEYTTKLKRLAFWAYGYGPALLDYVERTLDGQAGKNSNKGSEGTGPSNVSCTTTGLQSVRENKPPEP